MLERQRLAAIAVSPGVEYHSTHRYSWAASQDLLCGFSNGAQRRAVYSTR